MDVTHTLKGEGFDASEDGTGRGTPLWPVRVAPTLNAHFGEKQGLEDQHALNGGGCSSLAKCLSTKNQRLDYETETLLAVKEPIAFSSKDSGADAGPLSPTLRASASHSGDKGDGGMNTTTAIQGMAVRRLTPRECERLQGFPDDYTAIPTVKKSTAECPDGPRYKAIGNSMAVPVMRWLGNRISAVEKTRMECYS